MSTDEILRLRRREANARLLERGRSLAAERGLADPYGRDSYEYEAAKRADPTYQRLLAEFRVAAAALREAS